MRYLLLRLKRFCGFIAGFVFFIAGIFKLLDPVGAGLVMKEYMDFLHLGFLSAVAKPSAVALAFLETVIGTALITGIWRRATAVAAIAFQVFFTLLTLMLVIKNPDMDCGCFGEAIHLTHMQTFIKNIILLCLLLLFAIPFKHLGGPKKQKYVSFGLVAVSVVAFAVYSWFSIPLVDYTEFKPAMALQAGSAFGIDEEDMYEALFVYEKDGSQQEFTLDMLPDSTWNFIETRTVLKEDMTNSAVNLSFYDAEGEYKDILATHGKVLVISVYNPSARQGLWRKIADLIQVAEVAGLKPLVLVAAHPEQMQDIYSRIPELASGLKPYQYFSDYKTLITLNRSNAGVTFFSDGYLVRKWAVRSYPDAAEAKEIFEGDDTETIIGSSTTGSLAFQGFLLYVFAVMLLL